MSRQLWSRGVGNGYTSWRSFWCSGLFPPGSVVRASAPLPRARHARKSNCTSSRCHPHGAWPRCVERARLVSPLHLNGEEIRRWGEGVCLPDHHLPLDRGRPGTPAQKK